METKPSKFDFFTREGVRLNAGGLVDRAARFPVAAQYLDRTLWKRCVDQFDGRTDFCSDVHDEGWRGEYWGKMMRGAALTYDYTLDEELHDVLAQTVDDLLTRAADARLSSYPPGRDLRGWDVWGRKYVMLGLITFRGICGDEALVSRIDAALCRMADALIERVGAGKTEIYDTSDLWNGINSSSILEPFVLLYEITGAGKVSRLCAVHNRVGHDEGRRPRGAHRQRHPAVRIPGAQGVRAHQLRGRPARIRAGDAG